LIIVGNRCKIDLFPRRSVERRIKLKQATNLNFKRQVGEPVARKNDSLQFDLPLSILKSAKSNLIIFWGCESKF